MARVQTGAADRPAFEGLLSRGAGLYATLLCHCDGVPVPELADEEWIAMLRMHADCPPDLGDTVCSCADRAGPWHARRCPLVAASGRSSAHCAVQRAVRRACKRVGVPARVEVRVVPRTRESPRADIVVTLPAGGVTVIEVKTFDLHAPSWSGTVEAREEVLAARSRELYPGCATLCVTRCGRVTPAGAEALAALQEVLDDAANDSGVAQQPLAAVIAAALARAEVRVRDDYLRATAVPRAAAAAPAAV
jgi:hypothetical protein